MAAFPKRKLNRNQGKILRNTVLTPLLILALTGIQACQDRQPATRSASPAPAAGDPAAGSPESVPSSDGWVPSNQPADGADVVSGSAGAAGSAAAKGSTGLSPADVQGHWESYNIRVTATDCEIDTDQLVKEGWTTLKSKGQELSIRLCEDDGCTTWIGDETLVDLRQNRFTTEFKSTVDFGDFQPGISCKANYTTRNVTVFSSAKANHTTSTMKANWSGKDCGTATSSCEMSWTSDSKRLRTP